MFRPEEIRARLKVQPFRPLRIIAIEGLRYEIRHPDLVMVGVDSLMIGYASPESPTIYNKLIRVALIHIVGLEDLAPTPTEMNGTTG